MAAFLSLEEISFLFSFYILAKTLIHFCFNFYVKYPQGTQDFDICNLGNNLLNFNENVPERENYRIFFPKLSSWRVAKPLNTAPPPPAQLPNCKLHNEGKQWRFDKREEPRWCSIVPGLQGNCTPRVPGTHNEDHLNENVPIATIGPESG